MSPIAESPSSSAMAPRIPPQFVVCDTPLVWTTTLPIWATSICVGAPLIGERP